MGIRGRTYGLPFLELRDILGKSSKPVAKLRQ